MASSTRTPPYGSYAAIMGTFAGGLAAVAALGRLLDRDPQEQSTLDLVVLSAATFKAARSLAAAGASDFPEAAFAALTGAADAVRAHLTNRFPANPRTAAAVIVAISALLSTAGARAAAPPPAPLSLISPAVIDLDTNMPAALPSIAIMNRSDVGLRLSVFPALAAQALEGGLELRRSLHNDALARRAIRLTAPPVVGPHASVDAHLSFRSFAGRRTLSIAAVIIGTPLRRPPGTLRFRLRLLAAVFVHRPRVPAARPLISSVRATQLRPRLFDLVARVRNAGLKPAFLTSVRFRVLKAAGRSIASAPALHGFILPRSARNFRTRLSHRFEPGRFRVEAIVRWGTSETRRSGYLVYEPIKRRPRTPSP